MGLHKRLGWVLGLSLLLAAGGPPPAHAGLITDLLSSVTPQPSGLTLYQYTLTDDPGSTLPVVEFTLSVSTAADISSLAGPSGWQITYNAGDALVDWATFSADTVIQPGDSATFSFLSPLGPSQQDYSVLGLDPASFDVETNQGQTQSPGITAVPEPSALAMLGTGALGFLGYAWRH